ncbi:hypothetical protein HPP92_022929 [Vanilla planifolia]|uniref:Uncharacterized protein n=1 Tax=Vanilla planifolia TaxID=51239 RepID=A0A835PUH1_VANPL|nr:hypothetical protein HPP92_022929 [Vanilla planifolia]
MVGLENNSDDSITNIGRLGGINQVKEMGRLIRRVKIEEKGWVEDWSWLGEEKFVECERWKGLWIVGGNCKEKVMSREKVVVADGEGFGRGNQPNGENGLLARM